jgi:hypothetical protein
VLLLILGVHFLLAGSQQPAKLQVKMSSDEIREVAFASLQYSQDSLGNLLATFQPMSHGQCYRLCSSSSPISQPVSQPISRYTARVKAEFCQFSWTFLAGHDAARFVEVQESLKRHVSSSMRYCLRPLVRGVVVLLSSKYCFQSLCTRS